MRALLAALTALVTLLAPAAGTSAQADPAEVLRQYFEARNRDAAAAVAFFTEDAVYEGGRGLCAASPCVGKAAIQKEIERLVGRSRATISSSQVSGNTVTVRIEIRGDTGRAAGVERIVNIVAAEVRGDRISLLRTERDTSDSQTAAYLVYERVALVVARFDNAMNAGDADAALAFFADDAVVSTPAAVYTGKEQIRGWLQRSVAQHIQFELVGNRQVAGDKETHTSKVSLDDWRRLDIASIEGTAEVMVQEDKIRSFSYVFDFSEEALAKLREARPRALPRTGGVPFADYAWLLALGGPGLSGLGLALRCRCSRQM